MIALTAGPYITMIAKKLKLISRITEGPVEPRKIIQLKESDLVKWGFTPLNNPRRHPRLSRRGCADFDVADQSDGGEAEERVEGAGTAEATDVHTGAGPDNSDPHRAERGRRRRRNEGAGFDFGALEMRLSVIEQGQAALQQSVERIILAEEARATRIQERWDIEDERWERQRSWYDSWSNQWEVQSEFRQRINRFLQAFPPPPTPGTQQ